jgi:hypothetical protein
MVRMTARHPTSPLLGPGRNGSYGEGFRMRAHRDLSKRTEGRVRKPPGRNPRGLAGRSAVYGDLMGRRLG